MADACSEEICYAAFMKTVTHIACFVLLLLTLSGCTFWPSTIAGKSFSRNNFLMQMNGDNSSISLEGPSRVLPGESIFYKLYIQNKSKAQWSGKVCLVLITSQAVERQFDHAAFNLEPGASEEYQLTARFPPNLQPNSYGLGLIAPKEFSSTSIIKVGPDDYPSNADWPKPRCLE